MDETTDDAPELWPGIERPGSQMIWAWMWHRLGTCERMSVVGLARAAHVRWPRCSEATAKNLLRQARKAGLIHVEYETHVTAHRRGVQAFYRREAAQVPAEDVSAVGVTVTAASVLSKPLGADLAPRATSGRGLHETAIFYDEVHRVPAVQRARDTDRAFRGSPWWVSR
jgi:hypothetical protein